MSDDILDDQDAEKESGQIMMWYGLLVGVYLSNLPHDEVRRFLCLDMAADSVPGGEPAVKAAQAYEKFLIGKSPRVVE